MVWGDTLRLLVLVSLRESSFLSLILLFAHKHAKLTGITMAQRSRKRALQCLAEDGDILEGAAYTVYI